MYANQNSQILRAGSGVPGTHLQSRGFKKNISRRKRKHFPGAGCFSLYETKHKIKEHTKRKRKERQNKRALYDAPANLLAMPGISPAVPKEWIVANESSMNIELLEFFCKAFEKDIVYSRHESASLIAERNWIDAINEIYKESDGWEAKGNYRDVDFVLDLAHGESVYEMFSDYISYEEAGGYYFICQANDVTMFNIEGGIRHLEALEAGLGEAALVLLEHTPLNIYTPSKMYSDIQCYEWEGEDDETLRYENLRSDGYEQDEIEVTKKAEILESYPEWVLFPKLQKDIWDIPFIPEPMKKLKEACEHFATFTMEDINYDINRVACAGTFYGGQSGAGIMENIYDSIINDLQQVESINFSPFLLELDMRAPVHTINNLKAYFECVYWTGEFLKYLQGEIKNES